MEGRNILCYVDMDAACLHLYSKRILNSVSLQLEYICTNSMICTSPSLHSVV